MKDAPNTSLPIAVSMGDPAGVGPEIALMAWARRLSPDPLPTFAVVGSVDWLTEVSARLGLGPVCPISDIREANDVFQRALPVLAAPSPLSHPPRFGTAESRNAPTIVSAIEESVRLVAIGAASAVTTLPINKHVLSGAGFPYPGHTDFLGILTHRFWPGSKVTPVMMLASRRLRVVPVTVHVSMRKAIDQLTKGLILQKAHIVAHALKQDFNLPAPRLAIGGLNPHAGEDGLMGREEIDIITPAIDALQRDGINARGPLPSDTLFHEGARQSYDVALCMTHDQALIPIKTLDFYDAVNVTLGLPFVRTSPDHGTAFDCAGTGTAHPDSFMEALRLAARLSANRHRSQDDLL